MGERANKVEVRQADDAERFLATDKLVWFDEEGAAPVSEQLHGIPEELRFGAELPDADPPPDPRTYPGVYGVFPMTLTIPGDAAERGRQVDCAGLTWVGVHPDHRRQGVLTAMLRHHFEQVRDSGTLLSALHASEPAIYGRHGYGLASLELVVHLGGGTTLTAPHLEAPAGMTRTRLVKASDPGVPQRMRELELRVAADKPGAIVGELGYYERVCNPQPENERGKEPLRALFAIRDGVDVGVAVLRRSAEWERQRATGSVDVFHVLGDQAARLALLRRVVSLDLIGTAKVFGIAAEDPLFSWIGGPRGTSDIVVADSLWVRLVDLPGALAARSYATSCDVVVEVSDDAADWNAGAWRISVDGAGAATVTRTGDDAEVRLPIQALGSAYLGGGNLLGQLDAGVIEELRPGAVRELWRAFRTDTAPVTAIGF